MDIYWMDYWIEAKYDKMTLKEQTPGPLDCTPKLGTFHCFLNISFSLVTCWLWFSKQMYIKIIQLLQTQIRSFCQNVTRLSLAAPFSRSIFFVENLPWWKKMCVDIHSDSSCRSCFRQAFEKHWLKKLGDVLFYILKKDKAQWV